MKLTGSYKLDVKKEIAWSALNDPEILKQCIPGCDSFEKENDNTFNVTATNQIGPMNATFSGSVKLSNIQKNVSCIIQKSVLYKIHVPIECIVILYPIYIIQNKVGRQILILMH